MAYGLPYMVINKTTGAQEWYDIDRTPLTEAEAIAITADIIANNPNPTTMAEQARDLLRSSVAANVVFVNDPTVTLPQLIEQTRALSRQMNALILLAFKD